MKHGGKSKYLIVWGCITWYGIGFLCKIDGALDSELYQSILGGEFMETFKMV